jgi:hypothetical protein
MESNRIAVMSGMRKYIAVSLYRLVFFVTLIASFTLHADQSSEIENYTLLREKTPEFVPSDLQESVQTTVEVIEQEGVYHIKAVAIVRAPAAQVRHVLTDYVHIYRLNPSIIESEVIKRHDDGSVSVKTRVIGCAAYFCEELDRVEIVIELPSGDLQAEIIPELSDFKSGKTLWQIKSLGEKSEISYFSDMEPDIFVPPVVGKFLLKKSIRKEMQISFANLEKISSILAERERQKYYQPAFNAIEDDIEPGFNSVVILSGAGVKVNE